jgi:hypothetical protein
MAKTLVKAAHKGQHINGHGGCHTRWANKGFCCGVGYAEWLNSLGKDEETYLTINNKIITNLDVRKNWVTSSEHLVWAE